MFSDLAKLTLDFYLVPGNFLLDRIAALLPPSVLTLTGMHSVPPDSAASAWISTGYWALTLYAFRTLYRYCRELLTLCNSLSLRARKFIERVLRVRRIRHACLNNTGNEITNKQSGISLEVVSLDDTSRALPALADPHASAGRPSVREMQASLDLDQSELVARLSQLEALELIRSRAESGSRARAYELTPTGQAYLRAL